MLHPVCTDINKIFSHFRVIRIDLRHTVIESERVNLLLFRCLSIPVKRPFIDHKPVIILRLRSLRKDILPRCEVITAMIKYTVKHHADTALVRFFYQMDQRLFIAKTRIDLRIIGRVILMVRRRLIDRCQIQTIDSEILQIVQLTRNSRQVSAEALIIRHTSVIPPRHHIVRINGMISVTETIREDLIPDRIIYPCRGTWHITWIHPRKYKALTASALQMHLLVTDKTILKEEPALLRSL